MPTEPEEQTMPTADLHGSTIAIETGKGEKTTFELVRLGTVKEHETVKAALETAKTQLHTSGRQRQDFHDRLASMMDKRDAAEAAYKTEKEAAVKREQQLRILTDEAHALRDKLDSTDEKLATADAAYQEARERQGELATQRDTACGEADESNRRADRFAALAESEKAASAQLSVERDRYATERDGVRETNLGLHHEIDDTSVKLDAANEERGRLNGLLESARADFDELKRAYVVLRDDHDARVAELVAARAEPENLMTVKASLEETNTALEVSERNLAEMTETAEDSERVYTKYRADHVTMTTELAGVKGERDVSRQALADLTAELLKDAGCMSDILDAMHKKITGE